jgi:hypothetical protein
MVMSAENLKKNGPRKANDAVPKIIAAALSALPMPAGAQQQTPPVESGQHERAGRPEIQYANARVVEVGEPQEVYAVIANMQTGEERGVMRFEQVVTIELNGNRHSVSFPVEFVESRYLRPGVPVRASFRDFNMGICKLKT